VNHYKTETCGKLLGERLRNIQLEETTSARYSMLNNEKIKLGEENVRNLETTLGKDHRKRPRLTRN
jgi:hypothetical protein